METCCNAPRHATCLAMGKLLVNSRHAFSSIKNRPHAIVKIWWKGVEYTELDKKWNYEFISSFGLCSRAQFLKARLS